jgi:hypothetical protein
VGAGSVSERSKHGQPSIPASAAASPNSPMRTFESIITLPSWRGGGSARKGHADHLGNFGSAVVLGGAKKHPNLTPACKDCGHGGLNWPAAGERPRGVPVSDRDAPQTTVRSGTPRARSCSGCHRLQWTADPGLRPEDPSGAAAVLCCTDRKIIRLSRAGGSEPWP